MSGKGGADAAGGGAKGEPSLDDLQNRLKDFADKSKAAAEVQDHTTMAQELFAKIKAAGLKNVAALEQTFATNLDRSGSEYVIYVWCDRPHFCSLVQVLRLTTEPLCWLADTHTTNAEKRSGHALDPATSL